eukprot:jgi/Mesen1/11079/ME000099S10509
MGGVVFSAPQHAQHNSSDDLRGAPTGERNNSDIANNPAEGCTFHDKNSRIWDKYPAVARYNPPPATLPFPEKYYGQPFYKGFSWEKKVSNGAAVRTHCEFVELRSEMLLLCGKSEYMAASLDAWNLGYDWLV